MPKYDITLTITVEAEDVEHAWEKGDEAICSIDKTLICREIMDVGEPTLVEERKEGCIDFSKMTPEGFEQFLVELHSSNS